MYGLLKEYENEANKATQENLSYTEFLKNILECEVRSKNIRAKETLLKFASFPKVKTIDEFEYKSSSVNKTQINEILSLKFIERAENILFLEPSGVGKTHLAIAMGQLKAG